MTPAEIETSLTQSKCAVVEDAGAFALVYSYGYDGRKRSHDLAATTRDAALVEAWDWLHPEVRIAERIEIVQRVVARDFAVTVHDLCNGGRPEPLATARRVAMVLARELTAAPARLLGDQFGGREHSAIFHAEQSIADQIATDERFAARIGALREACRTAFAATREKGQTDL